MARLRHGEKQRNEERVYRIVRRHYNGLREVEIARKAGMERRRINNYLRALARKGKIERSGRLWFAT